MAKTLCNSCANDHHTFCINRQSEIARQGMPVCLCKNRNCTKARDRNSDAARQQETKQ